MIPLITTFSGILLLGFGACTGALWGYLYGWKSADKNMRALEQENMDLRDLVDTLEGGK